MYVGHRVVIWVRRRDDGKVELTAQAAPDMLLDYATGEMFIQDPGEVVEASQTAEAIERTKARMTARLHELGFGVSRFEVDGWNSGEQG